MALAYEPDLPGFAAEHEPLSVPRWTERPATAVSATVRQAQVVPLPLDRPVARESRRPPTRAETPASRSIYDMPINPLPAPTLEGVAGYRIARQDQAGAVILPFVRTHAQSDVSPIDYRPLWVAGAFLAASLCASVTVASSWFEVPPAQATSVAQQVASQITALIGVTGIAALAAVISTALLLVGAQRTHNP